MKPLSEIYADYTATLCYEDIPDQVIEKMKYLLMDYIGVSAAGYRCPAASKLKDILLIANDEESATVIGSPIKADCLNASLINGTISHYLDMDDGHKPSISHPAVAIFLAMLALCETRTCTEIGRASCRERV